MDVYGAGVGVFVATAIGGWSVTYPPLEIYIFLSKEVSFFDRIISSTESVSGENPAEETTLPVSFL